MVLTAAKTKEEFDKLEGSEQDNIVNGLAAWPNLFILQRLQPPLVMMTMTIEIPQKWKMNVLSHKSPTVAATKLQTKKTATQAEKLGYNAILKRDNMRASAFALKSENKRLLVAHQACHKKAGLKKCVLPKPPTSLKNTHAIFSYTDDQMEKRP
jgi:hypothetical protein